MTLSVKPYSCSEGVARLAYDPIREFNDLFLLKKTTALPLFWQLDHKIAIIDNAADKAIQTRWFKPTEALLHQLRDKINAEEKIRQVYPAQDSSACSILLIKKYNRPNEAKVLHDLLNRNDITVKDKTPIPDIISIINAVAKSKYRSKINLLDGYNKVKI